MGLVRHVFTDQNLKDLAGIRAIGHVRYSTTGSSNLKNAQPLLVDCARGQIAVAHNGNLVNADLLRDELEANGSIFQTTSDSEIILQLLAQPINGSRENQLISSLRRIQGAWSLVMMGEHEVIGARDPFGFRPLSIGKLDEAYILASETSSFDLIQAEFVRDVEPGEIVIINEEGLHSIKPFAQNDRSAFCIFEYVYFARPDSNLSNVNVSQARIRMGQELAKLYPVDADIVIPVPDSGNYAALGYSHESGIPYAQAFVRNHYIGRTFLQPTQLIRDYNVRIKLNIIKSMVEGKRVVVVDDSIVRGTTARGRVHTLREAGAKEVHVRVSCPPHKFPCHYGIDFPDEKDLIANQITQKEIEKYLRADSIGYLDVDGLVRACAPHAKEKFCLACFNGDYPVRFSPTADKLVLENRKKRLEPLLTKDELQQDHLL
jgi:amidophosphoribosyltransferase